VKQHIVPYDRDYGLVGGGVGVFSADEASHAGHVRQEELVSLNDAAAAALAHLKDLVAADVQVAHARVQLHHLERYSSRQTDWEPTSDTLQRHRRLINRPFSYRLFSGQLLARETWTTRLYIWRSCHKREKPQAPTPQAPIRNRQTRKVANDKGLNRNTNLA